MSVEQPEYKVLKNDGPFETRQYTGYVLAQVDVEADFDESLNRGFRVLADYIFGNNRVRKKIAMTVPVTEEIVSVSEKIQMAAPVTSESLGAGVYRVSFTMPREYILDRLPEPVNKNIRFREVMGHKVAVLRFSGHSHEKRTLEMISELAAWMDRNGLRRKSDFRLARYDPPWVPGFMRRNEVMADIE